MRILRLSLLLSIHCCALYAQKNISLVSTFNIPGQSLSGCWHYADTAGHEYALIGALNGIVFLDITQPTSPQFLFQLPGNASNWHEVKVLGDYAYAVSEGVDTAGIKNGVQIMDLRYLPDSVPFKFWQGDANLPGPIIKGHTVTVDNGFLYVNGHNLNQLGQGVLICSLADPWNPAYVGAITNNYSHDSYVRGNRLYSSEIIAGQFGVYDISNKSAPVLLATQATPNAFNHNTWLSDNGQVIFTTDERGASPVASYDISDLHNITKLDQYLTTNLSNSEAHNVRILNDYLINASYGSQVTTVDVSRPDNMIEIGNYPTGSFLCWDADPYLSNGNVLATDMNSHNVYILHPSYARACYLEGNVVDSVTGTPLSNVTVSIVGSPGVKTSNTAGDYRTGLADTGTYNVIFAKANYRTKLIAGVNLQSGIVTALNVELAPSNSSVGEVLPEAIASVYPNPATDRIVVDFNRSSEFVVRLFDAAGRCVYKESKEVRKGEQSILEVRSMPTGIYLLQIESGNGETTHRISIVH